MRILYHHRTLGDGAEGIHIAEMVNAFRALGHEVVLAGPAVGKRGEDQQNQRGVFSTLKKIVKGPAYEMMELGYNLYGYANLLKQIKEFRPHFIYDRYITFNYSCIAAGRTFGIPVVLEVNAPLAYERENESDERLYLKRISHLLEKKICSDASKTIVVSTPLKDYLVAIGVPENQVIVMPNGANTEKFNPVPKDPGLMAKYGISDSSFVVGFTGILRPWHGIDLLLESFKAVKQRFADSVLLLIGDGPIREEIEKKADQLGCRDSVKITGRVSHDAVKLHLGLLDVAVSPKATFYASPMKILEYMAMGKPVVAPNTANIRDIINSETTGLLFDENSSSSLTKKLCSLIESPEKMKTIGKEGLSEILFRLNWVNNAKQVINLVNNVNCKV